MSEIPTITLPKKKDEPFLPSADEALGEISDSTNKAFEEASKKPLKKFSKPWTPAKILEIPEHLKDSRFTYRWVDTDKPGNLRKKLSEGWEVDKELTTKFNDHHKTLQDGTNMDTTFRVREMIVMRMPVEIAKQRNKYYSKRSSRKIKDETKALQNVVGDDGYGKIKIEDRTGD